jgi:hypothetical protein
MKSAIPFGMIVVGVLLIVVSSLWAYLYPGTSSWTDEKATRAAEVKARLSDLGPLVNPPVRRMHSGPDPASLKAEFDALQKENEQLDADFKSAAERPNVISKMLKWSGISLAVLGIVGWYAVKQTS